MRVDMGVRTDVVTLLIDFEDADNAEGVAEGVTLETVEVLTDETEETVVDLGRYEMLLLLTVRGVVGLDASETTVPVRDLDAIDIVRD